MPIGADEAEESDVRTARSHEGCTEHTGGSISVDCSKQAALASGDQFPCEFVVAFADFDVESSALIVGRPD